MISPTRQPFPGLHVSYKREKDVPFFASNSHFLPAVLQPVHVIVDCTFLYSTQSQLSVF